MVAPIIAEAKHRNPELEIVLVFWSRSTFELYQRAGFLRQAIDGVVTKTLWVNDDVFPKFKKIKKIVSLLRILSEVLNSRRPVLLHAQTMGEKFYKTIIKAIRFKGGTSFAHPKSLVLVHGRTSEGLSNFRDDDGFLCFSEKEVGFYSESGTRNVVPIGYTRFYRSWLTTVVRLSRQNFDKIKGDEFDESLKTVLLLLGSTVEGIFDLDELEEWVSTVFSTLGNVFGKANIIIKPHPCQNMAHLDKVLSSYRQEYNIIVTSQHQSVLSECSDLVISHHTSAMLDAAAMKKSLIFYFEPTQKWIDTHKDICFIYSNIGIHWSKNKRDFYDSVFRSLGEKIDNSFVEVMGHKENISHLGL